MRLIWAALGGAVLLAIVLQPALDAFYGYLVELPLRFAGWAP